MLTKLPIGLAVSALACMLGGPLLAHVGILPAAAGLIIFASSGLLGLGAIAVGATAALRRKAYFPAMIGMLGCLPIVAVTAGIADGIRAPAINDIATDLADPPAFTKAPTLPENAGRDFTFPEANKALITASYPEVKPLALPKPADQVYRVARGIAASDKFGWTITARDDNAHQFEAVATTRLFRWEDDVVVRIRPDKGGGCIVDMRSKSREGKGDLGVNARRIRQFFEALKD